jgi:hypothetical protein
VKGVFDRISLPQAAGTSFPLAELRLAANTGTLRHVRVGRRRVLQTTQTWVEEWQAQRA